MALNIKNVETERLAAEIAQLTGESKTAAIHGALVDRREKLRALHNPERRLADALRFLEDEIWSQLPAEERGKPITKAEREEILGYGPDGFCL